MDEFVAYRNNIFQRTFGGMIRGTNHDQDARFSDKTKKMLEKSQWPDKYDIKVDLKKVDYELVKVWIEKKIAKLLGEEDDIVSGTIISHLDESLQKQQKLNAKQLHVAISGVLQEKTLIFMSEFWDILDEAQRSARGIPECLLQEKKKSEQVHKRTLRELEHKRHKMNVSRFNQEMRRTQYGRGKDDYKAPEDREEREKEFEKKKKHRDRRSHSRSRHKKHRSRSFEKKRYERSRDKHSRRQRRKSSSSEGSQVAKNKEVPKHERRGQSSESDSSGVVSSSSSSN